MQRAEGYCIRQAQFDQYASEIDLLSRKQALPVSHALNALRPYWDPAHRLLRVTGRLTHLYVDSAPPILMPSDHRVTLLLIRRTHASVFHAGVSSTLAKLRERFWIRKGRQQVRKVLRKCVTCARIQSRHYDAPAAPLPRARLTTQPPFSTTGVDFAGPLIVKSPHGPQKTYLVMFTCVVVRAVHLELIPDMTTNTFLCALRKFAARRGLPRIIYSDNGLTFKSAALLIRNVRTHQVMDFLSEHRGRWVFSANFAPWCGGWWERMIGTTKGMLRKTILRESLSFL